MSGNTSRSEERELSDRDHRRNHTGEPAQASELGGLLKGWLYRRFGAWGLLAPVLVVAAFAVWWQWDRVRELPGVVGLLEYGSREPLPKANPEQFAVAHLENDESGEVERLIIEDLEEFEGVQVLSVDRTIGLGGAAREESEKRGHEEARRYLSETGASVLVWGTVVRNENRALPKLYLTTSPRVETHSGRYRPTEDLRLPELFWADLADVLRLVIVSRDAEFGAKRGQYIADKLPPFIAKVRRLLGASEGAAGWDPNARASTLLVFADSLYALGEQRGENAPLEEAVSAYRAALEELTRERVPLDWAMTQNNLGIALASVAERTANVDLLIQARQAVEAAYRLVTEAGYDQNREDFETRLREIDASIAELKKGDRSAGAE